MRPLGCSYAGSAADRAVLQEHDFWVAGSGAGCGGRRGRRVRPHVVLSSYETVLRDQGLFQSVEWESVVIDEGEL